MSSEYFGAVFLGATAFAAFVAADLIAQQVPVLAHGLAAVLPKSTGASALILVVVVTNAAGEEVFFRGAVQTAFGVRHAAVLTTAVYAVVTFATLNVALVIAAVVMGTLFSLERRSTRSVVAVATVLLALSSF